MRGSLRAVVVATVGSLGAVASLIAPHPAVADTCTTTIWLGTAGGDWANGINWDQGAPDNTKIASIPAAQSSPITNVSGTACGLTAGGDVTLDGSLTFTAGSAPVVDVGTATVTVGSGTWTLPDGATLKGDLSPTGTLLVANGANLALGGVVTAGAIVHLAEGAIMSAASPATMKQSGSGEFDWFGGSLTGDITLNVLTIADGAVTRTVPSGSKVTVKNAMEVRAGGLAVDGTLRNSGILRLYDATTVSSPAATGVLETGTDPLFPSTLYVGTDSVFDSGTVTMSGVSLRTNDTLSIDAGMRLVLSGAPSAPTSSTLFNGTMLTSPQAAASGQAPGTLAVTQGSRVTVQGKTTFQKGVTLALDDGADGTKAGIIGTADGIVPATLVANTPTDGSFAWSSGTVTGPLATSGTALLVNNGGGSSARVLSVPSGLTTPALSLSGPATFASAGLRLGDHVVVKVAAQTTQLDGAATFFAPTGALAGQSVVVASGATLRRLPSSGSGTAPSETGTTSVPLLNNGTVELDASLSAAGGYSQAAPATPASGASAPVTAMIAGSTLSSPNTVSIAAGGIGGKGTVHAPTLNVQNAWIAPGYRGKCHELDSTVAETCVGTLDVSGALHLTPTSDVQVVVRSDSAHDELVTTGAATLAGRLTVATGTNYKPKVGFTATKLVRYASRSGGFATTSSPAAPVGFSWRPAYDDTADANGRGVNAYLVDSEAPVMGFAGIPAFTQQSLLEVTYAAVDNSSGVASYDVRWRRVGLTGSFSKWVYPKAWQKTKAKSQVINGLTEGYTYCASVRARDRAGNVSAWTAAPCSALELDDRLLRADGGWSRLPASAHWYDKTYSQTTAHGASLSKYGTFTRVAVSAFRCPTCGTVEIFAGKKLLKTWVLKSTKTGKVNYVSSAAKLRTTRVWIKVTSRHKTVRIDALGLLH